MKNAMKMASGIETSEEMIKALGEHPGYRPPPPNPPPATEKTFKEVMLLWNLLPDDWAADTRISLLGCYERNFLSLHAFYSGQRIGKRRAELYRNKIKPVSAKFLKIWTRPLGEEYRSALELAAWWHDFARQNYPLSAGQNSAIVKRWLSFQDDNLPKSDDYVATWRTGQELIALHKFNGLSLSEFWKLSEPTLAVVKHAQKRWLAYQDARTRARNHFSMLDVPAKLADYASPGDALWRMEHGFWQSNDARKLAAQLADAEREMVLNPSKLLEFVGDNLHSSRDLAEVLTRTHRSTPAFLDSVSFMGSCACGLVSREELHLTLPTFFPKLSLDEKLKFLKLAHAKPRQIKKNRFALLKTWLQDNVPVFSEFRWHTEAVLDAAVTKFNDPDKTWIPETPELLTQFCSRAKPKILLGLHRARYQHETSKFARPNSSLLTVPPLLV